MKRNYLSLKKTKQLKENDHINSFSFSQQGHDDNFVPVKKFCHNNTPITNKNSQSIENDNWHEEVFSSKNKENILSVNDLKSDKIETNDVCVKCCLNFKYLSGYNKDKSFEVHRKHCSQKKVPEEG